MSGTVLILLTIWGEGEGIKGKGLAYRSLDIPTTREVIMFVDNFVSLSLGDPGKGRADGSPDDPLALRPQDMPAQR